MKGVHIELSIGGDIDVEALAKLSRLCEREDLCFDYDDSYSRAEWGSLEQLAGRAGKPLDLSCMQHRDGCIEDLKDLCSEHGLTFNLVYGGTPEVPADITWWTPGMESVSEVLVNSTARDRPMVDLGAIASRLNDGSDEEALASVRAFIAESTPAEVPPFTLTCPVNPW